MTVFRSDIATGIKPTGRPQTAGAVHCQRVTFVFSSTFTAASDKLDLGVLVAGATIVDAILVPEGTLTDATAKIGLMSGSVGSLDNARTVGSEVFEDIELDEGTKRAVKPAGFLIPAVDYDRSIGLTIGGVTSIAGASTKKVTLLLFYMQ